MAEFLNECNISVIQGDVLELYFIIENIDKEQIEQVFFTCNEKGIQVELEYSEDEQGYALRLESADTSELEVGLSSYDLTLKFADEGYFTAVYEGIFDVLPKKNKVEV